MRTTRVLPIALVASILSGCATPYGSSGLTGGYRESKISESAYVVSFSGNGFASRDRVYYFWVYRCSELTLQQGYALYAIRPAKSTARQDGPAATLRPAVYRSADDGRFLRTRSGGYTAPVIIPGGPGATKWSYSGTILMYKAPLPGEVLWAVDAQQAVEALKPYVTSNGSSTPPTRAALFRRIFTAHARITIGSGATVAAESPAEAGAADARPVRAAEDIANAVEEARRVSLQQLFRDYQMHSGNRRDPADVVLQFSVSPNGLVKDCHVTETSVTDPAFGSRVEDLVRQTEFGARDVAATAISKFRIEFAPL